DAQNGTLANGFTYLGPAPTVSSVAPTSGPSTGGTAVTITGTSFATGATVTVGGSAATGVTVVNSTTITATTPAHAAGAVSVTVTNADAQSGTLASGFTYVAPAPTVTGVAPTSGSSTGGTGITITGTSCEEGRDGSDGECGRQRGDGRDGCEQHDNHGDDTGACGGRSERDGDECRRTEWHAGEQLHLCRTGADGDERSADVGLEQWRHGDHDHGN